MILLWLLACGADAAIARGDAALGKGDLLAAEAAYREAVAADPDRAEALYGLGWTYHLAGDEDAAQSAFDQLTRLHPESPLGFKGLGSVAMARDNLPLARSQFQVALERSPSDRKVRQSLGLLELKAGNPTQALATFEALVAEDPSPSEFHQGRGQALLMLGRGDDALAEATVAEEKAADPHTRAGATMLRVRALLVVSSGRVNREDCAGTAPPVLAWLDAADRALDEISASKVPINDVQELRREVRRRRAGIGDLCPEIPGDG